MELRWKPNPRILASISAIQLMVIFAPAITEESPYITEEEEEDVIADRGRDDSPNLYDRMREAREDRTRDYYQRYYHQRRYYYDENCRDASDCEYEYE